MSTVKHMSAQNVSVVFLNDSPHVNRSNERSKRTGKREKKTEREEKNASTLSPVNYRDNYVQNKNLNIISSSPPAAVRRLYFSRRRENKTPVDGLSQHITFNQSEGRPIRKQTNQRAGACRTNLERFIAARRGTLTQMIIINNFQLQQ